MSDQAASKPPKSVMWCLRIGAFLGSVGVFGRYFLSKNELESSIFGVLYFEYGWAESVAQSVDDWGTIACCIAGLIVVAAALLQRQRIAEYSKRVAIGRFFEGFAATAICVWMLTLAVTQMLRGGAFAELSLGEHAVRYTLPFVLAMFCVFHDMIKWPSCQRVAIWMLTIASAATFIIHGYKALLCYGPFTDLVLLSDSRSFGINVSQRQTEIALVVIGVLDVLVAVILLAFRWRYAALYMAGWGLLTATSRMTAFGWAAWPETLIRSANWAAPLAIFFLCCEAARRRDGFTASATASDT